MTQLYFGLQTYQHRSLPLSAQRAINCYLEKAPEGSKTEFANVQMQGTSDWTTVGNGPMRGGIVVNGTPWVVSGQELYTVASTGTGTLKGSIPGSNLVDMTSDGTNVLIANAGVGYLWNGSALAAIADLDFPGVAVTDYLDGYAIVIEPSSGRTWINETTGDWSAWNALDFATAEGWPDDTIDLIVDHREVFLGGRETTEVWYNSGAADFPLSRLTNGFIERGVLCSGTYAKHDNTIFFVGNDGVVYRLEGLQPIRISSHWVEQQIEDLTPKVIRGFTWSEKGHAFYAISSTDWTMVYDISTGTWHERQSYDEENWRTLTILRAHEKWLVLDSLSNKIGYLNENTFTEWGEVLRSSATAPAISNENRWLFHNRLELVFEQGIGTSGQGANPQVMVDWSDDGGRTWSAEHFRPLGATGLFKTRAIVNRLGRSRDRVYRFAVSDPVRRTLIQANYEAEVGEF